MQIDVDIKDDGFRFKLRVSAIVKKNNKILLSKGVKFDGFCFPGGHVMVGESTREAIQREIREEVGLDIQAGDLLCVDENIYSFNGKITHEINYYYYVDYPMEIIHDTFERVENEKGKIKTNRFCWIDLEQKNKFNIQPTHIVDLVLNKEKNKIIITDNR